MVKTIKSQKARLNNGSKAGVIITHLSNRFDSFNHEFLLAKFRPYDPDNNSVAFMRSYLPNRLQSCKTNNS